MSEVRLIERKGSILRMKRIDVLDGTPLIDMKPYVPSFDHRAVVRIGWLEGRSRQTLSLRQLVVVTGSYVAAIP